MSARCTRYPPDLGGDTGRPDSHRSRSRMAFCVWPGVGPVNCGERRRAVGACGLRPEPTRAPARRIAAGGYPVGASRALPAVASHAIGYADSGLAAHSRGSRRLRGRREESRNGWRSRDGAGWCVPAGLPECDADFQAPLDRLIGRARRYAAPPVGSQADL